MNILRCTLPRSRNVKPTDAAAAKYFLAALDRSQELFHETGRKLVVGNFANILLAIVAPAARKLMCDISPCGGGRCFFAVAPGGDVFPCSEFIGLERFCGGNLFRDKLPDVLASEPFRLVTERKIEQIEPCGRCAIRHFCGAPCPAEAHEIAAACSRSAPSANSTRNRCVTPSGRLPTAKSTTTCGTIGTRGCKTRSAWPSCIRHTPCAPEKNGTRSVPDTLEFCRAPSRTLSVRYDSSKGRSRFADLKSGETASGSSSLAKPVPPTTD